MKFLSCLHPKFAATLVYMLQASEYRASDYLAWCWRVPDFRKVARRGSLDLTQKARLLLLFARTVMALQVVAIFASAAQAVTGSLVWLAIAAILLVLMPIVTIYSLVVILWLGRIAIQSRREKTLLYRAYTSLAKHPGLRIAIAGSYGKTTFKELLKTILSEEKTVAATPGNMNTPLGISRFIESLSGGEEVLIFELGEYYPGDIKELCELVRPEIGVITGINEAHLSKFKTLDKTTATIFELADYLQDKPVYKNGDNALVRGHIASDDPLVYTEEGINGWKISDIKIGLDFTSFTAKKGLKTIKAKTRLLGRQQIGPLAACIDIATRLGLSAEQISGGISRTAPYEHRMQPTRVSGAWVIDDTYNGNTDGVAAGLEWLSAVPATRRIYVTPGLVEQGAKSREVHEAIGRRIAAVADVAVLMKNSTTPHIRRGLTASGFAGQILEVEDPVHFYHNLDQFVASGDVVLMQNDWTDNYA